MVVIINVFLKKISQIINRILTVLKLLIDINLAEKILKENETKWKRFGLFIFQPFIWFSTLSTIDINWYRLLIFLN